MATDEKGLFWNSLGGDRKYDAESMTKWLSKFFTPGVFYGDCAVSAGTGLNVVVAPGYANIANPNASSKGGKALFIEESKTISIEMADGSNARIDTIVIERNDDDREITVKAVKGTPGLSPSPKAPVRNSTVYQIVLAEVYVDVGATSISSSDITDKRDDPAVCGIISCTLNNFSYGTADLTPGSSDLATGTFYFKYESE